jgi:hypothetical protein
MNRSWQMRPIVRPSGHRADRAAKHLGVRSSTAHLSSIMLSRRARSAAVVRLLTVPRGVLVRREISLCERPSK